MNTSVVVDKYIISFDDWRGEKLAQLRRLIVESDTEMIEEWKWDVPVYSHNGMICAISSFKDHVKINFFNGAALNDPLNLFNSGLESKQHRSINHFKDDQINIDGIKDLIREAIVFNSSKNQSH